ncbi:hypothetical protein [Bacillus sp. 196mf]|uniref:hypothetical protein n=1 Tax=Bacillus sp. 196mf TaxID=1761754 RepID=UPI000D90D5B7|nr:hypothetical protein [Bacillus sp. 196mf]PYE87255.1 hypothetical protein ATL10_10803 [Bacillus sp. 196mf]
MKKAIARQNHSNAQKAAFILEKMYTTQGYSPEEIAKLTGLPITEVLIQLKLV